MAATILSRRRKVPLHDQVCFHCQQSAEKYLKARLEEANIRIPKTHDLEELLDLVLPLESLWSALRPALEKLTDFGVEFRNPGHDRFGISAPGNTVMKELGITAEHLVTAAM